MNAYHSKKSWIIGITFVLSLFVLVLSISLVSAGTLFCLEEGQTIRFSECNPAIDDKTCTTSICQLCVTQLSNGAYCPASLNSCNSSCIAFEDTQDVSTLAEVSLLSPSNLFIAANTTTVSFLYEITKPSTIEKCELMLNNVNVTKNVARIQSGTNSLSYKVPIGSHEWKIRCKLRSSATFVNSETRSMSIGQTSENNQSNNSSNNNSSNNNPALEVQNEIFLLTPDNNYATLSQDIFFSYNFSQSIVLSNLSSCNLNVENVLNPINLSEISNRKHNMSISFSSGLYSWKVVCSYLNGQNVSSITRSLTINNPDPVNNNNGGGGGGGGGGSTSGRTTAINSTNSSATSSVSASNESENNQTETNTEETIEQSGFGITGAAIGNALKNNKVPVIVFLVVLIVVAVLIYYKKSGLQVKK